jgi:hypothetical protein
MLNDPVLDGREGTSRGLMPAKDVIPVVKGSGSIPETRAILVGTAGTINVVMASGDTRNAVPVQTGVTPLRIQELLAGGTADNIWGIY